MSTQAKLDAKDLAIKNIEAILAEANEDKERLKAKLAEEQKPKLRHGDYGCITRSGSARLACRTPLGRLGLTGVNGTHCNNKWDEPDTHLKLGNIFDDLAAMQTGITEYFAGDLKVCISECGSLRIGGGIYVAPEELSGFVMAVRQIEMEIKRRNKK